MLVGDRCNDAPLSASTLSLRQHNLGTLFAALYPAQNKIGPFAMPASSNLAGRSELAKARVKKELD
jgi:hypothetical protein